MKKQSRARDQKRTRKGRGWRAPWMLTSAVVASTVVAGKAVAPAQAQDLDDASTKGGVTKDADGKTGESPAVTHRFDIAAGSIDSVMASFAKITGVQVVVAMKDIGSLPSPGVSGVYTAEQALQQLLVGTGVSARFVGANTVSLELSAAHESVDVTARAGLESPKYTAPLRDTPRSITVIPESVIQSTGSATLVEALRTVPGITFGAGEGGNPVGDRPFIRGYDTQASTFVDGVRDIGAQSREVFNLESVEVSKGPNGSFGGRGSAGGAINLNSKTPRLGNSLSGTVTPGTSSYIRSTIDGNYMLSDSVAFRFNAMGHDQDVAGRKEVHNRRWGVAPSLAVGLGKTTRLTVGSYHVRTDDLPDSGIPYNNPAFVARTDGAPRVLPTGDGTIVDVPRDTFYGLTNRDFRKDTIDAGTARVEHDFSRTLTLRNTTRYAQTGQDYIWTQPDDSKGNLYYGMVWRRTNTRVSDVSTIFNQTDLFGAFQTGRLKHTFSTGVEFSREKGENDTYVVATGTNTCPNGIGAAGGYNCTDLFNPNPNDPWTGLIARNDNPTNSRTVTRSAYAVDTVQIHPKWEATLGLRLDDYSARFVSAIDRNATTGTPAVPNPNFGLRSTFERDDTLVNYQLGVVFKPTQAGSIYSAYSTSSQPTGNALAQGSDSSALSSTINANLKPEENRSVEVGTKWDLFGNRLLATAAVFRTQTTNARITLQDGSVAMAGEKRVQGVELGLAGRLTDKWQAFGGYTFLDSELVRNGGSGAAFGLQDGMTFPNTPKNSFSLWSTYAVRPQLTVGGGAYYVSKVWGSQPNNKWVPSYWRLDATASYRFNPHLGLQLNLQNLTDEFYFIQAYPTHYASVAPGRTATLTLNVGI